MLFFGIQNKWFRWVLAAVFAVLSLIFLLIICQDYFIANPYVAVPTYRETRPFNKQGDFSAFATIIVIEFLILAAVLLPYSFSRFYWVRLLILQILFALWFLIFLFPGSGSPGSRVGNFHTLYLLIINVVIFILFIASIVAEIVARKKLRIQNGATKIGGEAAGN